MEETALITQILQGKTAAFATIIEQYKDRVFTLALRLSGNQEDAEEIVQDVFLKVYENLRNFEGNSKFSTWLYSIAYNTAVSKLRSGKKRQNEIVMEDYNVVETQGIVGVLEPLKREEQRFFLAKALQQLKPEDRVVVELHYLEEMKIEEIEEITGDTNSNVKVKLYRARRKLCSILTQMLEEEAQTLY